MLSINKQYSFFIMVLAGFCLCYLGLILSYNHYALLSVDEFWFAHRIYEYKDGLPYRDFAPYKTILGYYFLLPPMLSGLGIIKTLLFTKDCFAVLNTFVLFASSLWLTRYLSREGVLISLVILIASEIVISYSTQIRVDLLGYWFCLFSLLLLLEKRYLLAGLLLGLGFATTQKAIWYIFASNCALGLHWLIYTRDFKTFKQIIWFNFACALVIGCYLAFWSWIADWNTVFNSVFGEASAMYNLSWYDPARKLFWQVIISYNPLIFLLCPITLFSLFITYENDTSYHSRFIIVLYACVIMLCLMPYKQVFPYYMQVTIPVFLCLYASFITWVIGVFQANNTLYFVMGNKKIPLHTLKLSFAFLWLLVQLYFAIIILLSIQFELPKSYLLIGLIPISLIAFITADYSLQEKLRQTLFNLIIIATIFVGLVYPLILFSVKIINFDGGYQQANVKTINALIQDGSDYVAGIELIYNKTQPISGMRHLMGPAIDYLYSPTEKLKKVMLASLYEDPNATMDTVINSLKNSSVKFYVNNYRINALPKKIREYLHSEYEHWWGSIYLYSPLVAKGQQEISLKFSGKYLIESQANQWVKLNGKTYKSYSLIDLQKGEIISNSDGDFRLKLMPEIKTLDLNPEYQFDSWGRMMF